MNKNLTKKALVPALAMALASVIALSGVTYAWFTTGNTAQVGSLDVNVQTADGIQVSLDAQSWKSLITVQDIINARDNSAVATSIQYPDGEIAPVSTAGYFKGGKMEMFKGTLEKDGTLTSVAETEGKTGNYIAFDLYFNVLAESQMLSLDGSVKCINLADSGKDSDLGTEKAVRIAFVPVGEVIETGNSAGARNAKVADGTRASLIWEPNAAQRIPATAESGEGVKSYEGLKSAFEKQAIDQLSANGYAETMPTTFDGAQESFYELKKGINKFRIYIWLEGQDIDCVNDISFGDFKVDLSFSVPETENN